MVYRIFLVSLLLTSSAMFATFVLSLFSVKSTVSASMRFDREDKK